MLVKFTFASLDALLVEDGFNKPLLMVRLWATGSRQLLSVDGDTNMSL